MNSHSARTVGDYHHERNFLLARARRMAEAAALVREAAAKLGILMPEDHLRLTEEARVLERKCAELVADAYAEDQ